MVKILPASAGDTGSIPDPGKSLGGGNGNPLSILAWRMPWTKEPGVGGTAVHAITKSQV